MAERLTGREEHDAWVVATAFLSGGEGTFLTATEAKAKRIFARAKEIVDELVEQSTKNPGDDT